MVALEFGKDRRSFLKKFIGGVAAGALALRWGRGLAAWPEFLRTCQDSTRSGEEDDESFWRLVRQQFPLSHERTYLNNGGLGPSPRVVIDTYHDACLRLERISETGHGERRSVHEKAAAFLGCDVDEIAFTRSTTEGMNIIARGLPLQKGDEVLMSTHEHVGGAIPWLGVAKDVGIKVRLFEPGNSRGESLRIIESTLTKKTKVLSLSHIPCTTGLVFPVEEIARICHERGIIVVYDGAHPPGMIPVNLHDIGCDFYATSGHKWLLGPKGTGLLYIRKEMFDVWRPTYVGAYSSSEYDLDSLMLEYKREANVTEYGTRNTPLVLALGAAMDFLNAIGMERVAARGAYLASHLKTELSKMSDIEVLTPFEQESSASITTFRPKNMKHSDMLNLLGKAGFRLRNIGEHRLNAIRVSTHVYTSMEEVERLIDAVRRILRES